jgi:OmpA-OmpF porin, OOP family
MKTYRILAAPILLVGLAACTGTPTNGLLPGSTYQLDQLNMARATGSPFTQALTNDYRNLANYEMGEVDWNAQQHFAKKGLVAARGTAPQPTDRDHSDWGNLKGNSADELAAARVRLMTMLGGDAPSRLPQLSSTAQTSFDCWLHEQHEGWEIDRIAECRNGFMTAMDKINAPPPKAVMAEPAAPAPAPTLYMVFFDFDKSELSPEARNVIANAAHAIAAGQQTRIGIDGYADTSGTDQYNLKLSSRRGEAVRRELIRNGVAPDSISVEGKGETAPLQQTADGVREPQNRRATIDLMGR